MARMALRTALLAVLFSAFAGFQPSLQAQTFQVIHQFTGQDDSGVPNNTLAIDRAGNLYGTTAPYQLGFDAGTTFRMVHRGSGWIFTTLQVFGGTNGSGPAGVTIGPDGAVYGSTDEGGDILACTDGCGVVYELRPAPTPCRSVLCPWTETVLHQFEYDDGYSPDSTLVFDQSGNLYGTAGGGTSQDGLVYKLTRSGGGYSESTAYSFPGGAGGANPAGGLTFDTQGRLYGTTGNGGDPNCWLGEGCGIAFQLTPSGSGWTENVLYTFEMDAYFPTGLIVDGSGNLYGATGRGGGGGGTVFELTPSNGTWIYTLLYAFPGSRDGGPARSLTMDRAGNLYGTTYTNGMFGYGSVFKLTPSNGSWTYTSLHDFTGGVDGGAPIGGVAIDANGNLYGTTTTGGQYENCRGFCGVVWEITP